MWEKIIETYPELTDKDFEKCLVELRDDGDGIVYIYQWNYDKPIPTGLKVGK